MLVARSSNFLLNPQVTESQARHPLCPEPLRESKEARRPRCRNFLRVNLSQVSDSSSRPVSLSVEDTFKESFETRPKKAQETLEDFEVACVTGCFRTWDPSTGQTVCTRSLVDFFQPQKFRVHHESSQDFCSPHLKIRTFRRFDV